MTNHWKIDATHEDTHNEGENWTLDVSFNRVIKTLCQCEIGADHDTDNVLMQPPSEPIGDKVPRLQPFDEKPNEADLKASMARHPASRNPSFEQTMKEIDDQFEQFDALREAMLRSEEDA